MALPTYHNTPQHLDNAPVSEVPGYHDLATHMGHFPETAIFRRFGALASRLLLYLQAELIGLERQLRAQELADSRSGHLSRSQQAIDWEWIRDSEKNGTDEQLKLLQEIKGKYHDYCTLLIQQTTIASLSEPSKQDLKDIQRFAEPLIGEDGLVWGFGGRRPAEPSGERCGSLRVHATPAPDAVAIKARRQFAPITTWVLDKLVLWFHQKAPRLSKEQDPVLGETVYSEDGIVKLVSTIAGIIAWLLPVAAISVLSFVNETNWRLITITAFSLLFFICLWAFTAHGTSDTFAVITAFVALLGVCVNKNNAC